MAKKAAIGATRSNGPRRKTFLKNTFCTIAMGLLLSCSYHRRAAAGSRLICRE